MSCCILFYIVDISCFKKPPHIKRDDPLADELGKSKTFPGIRRDLRYSLEVVGFMVVLFSLFCFIRVICLRERAERAGPILFCLFSVQGWIHDVVIDMEMDILKSDPVRSNKHQSFMENA